MSTKLLPAGRTWEQTISFSRSDRHKLMNSVTRYVDYLATPMIISEHDKWVAMLPTDWEGHADVRVGTRSMTIVIDDATYQTIAKLNSVQW